MFFHHTWYDFWGQRIYFLAIMVVSWSQPSTTQHWNLLMRRRSDHGWLHYLDWTSVWESNHNREVWLNNLLLLGSVLLFLQHRPPNICFEVLESFDKIKASSACKTSRCSPGPEDIDLFHILWDNNYRCVINARCGVLRVLGVSKLHLTKACCSSWVATRDVDQYRHTFDIDRRGQKNKKSYYWRATFHLQQVNDVAHWILHQFRLGKHILAHPPSDSDLLCFHSRQQLWHDTYLNLRKFDNTMCFAIWAPTSAHYELISCDRTWRRVAWSTGKQRLNWVPEPVKFSKNIR